MDTDCTIKRMMCDCTNSVSADNDIVDWDVDELDKVPNESHDQETDG